MDTIQKAMYLGLGAISLTKEKAEGIIDDLVKRGEMKEQDRRKMVEQLLKEGKTQKGMIEENVSALVQKTMGDMGLPTRKEFKNIVKRLDGIEKAIKTPNSKKEGTKA
jgi:polyhydroxyalkanoate synthesis regulator phasin